MPQKKRALEKSNFVMHNAEEDPEEIGFYAAMSIVQSEVKIKPTRRYFGRRLKKRTKTYLH